MMSRHYENLRVFQSADALVHLIFNATITFPTNEHYVTVSQIRRSSLSVVLNIVEGNGKRLSSNKEFVKFLKIAYGSLTETEYLIEFCFKRNYLDIEQYNSIRAHCQKCGGELWMLIKAQE